MDGFLQHDEVGPGRSRGDDGGRLQGAEHLRRAFANDGHLRRREPGQPSAGEVDSVARVNQQHIRRVVLTIDRVRPR